MEMEHLFYESVLSAADSSHGYLSPGPDSFREISATSGVLGKAKAGSPFLILDCFLMYEGFPFVGTKQPLI